MYVIEPVKVVQPNAQPAQHNDKQQRPAVRRSLLRPAAAAARGQPLERPRKPRGWRDGLTCCAVAIITTVTSLAIKLMLGGAGSMLLLSLLLIGQVAAAAYWLRGVSRRWESV